ncbi:hypothetical protein Tco_0117724, partial [Tanacetum coccineum]
MVSTIKLPILKKVPPKTAQALLQRQRERKAKSILLLAIPDEYQLRFHGIKDAKSLWAAIKSRFGGNVESKKMQKTVLKQQFENFSVSDTEGLDKAYDRFQKLISLLEVHGAAVPNEDANQKFLRALPSSWNNVALIMRNKDGIDDLDIDDLYNNLKVFEADIKGSSGSSSNSQNVAFLSAEDTSSSNEVNTANGVSTASGYNSQGQASSSSYTDDLMFSFFANQLNSPQLDDEDLEQIDHDDLRGHFARECRASRNQGNRNGDAGYKSRDNTRRTVLVETSDALVVQDNALILVVHQKNEAVCKEKIAVLEFEVKDKSNAVIRHKNQLDETLREKDDLKAKLEYFETSSKNLNKLINSQISSKDKTGLGYGDQLNENDSSGSELFNSVFDSRSSNGDDNQTNDRPTSNKTSASVSQVETSITPPSNTSVEMPRVESVRPSRVIIEDWVSDDDEDIFQSNDLQATDKLVLKRLRKNTVQREIRLVWNNVQRINHQNKFVPSAVLTRSGKVPVSTAKKSSLRATTSTSTFRPVNNATHTTPNTRISNEKVNTVRVNGVNTVGQTIVSDVK